MSRFTAKASDAIMSRLSRSVYFRYGLVPVAVGLALLSRLILWDVLGDELPFLILWPAVMLCAWYGGFGPGLLATVVSVFAAHRFLLDSPHAFTLTDPNGVVGMGLFVLLGFFLSLIGQRLRRAKMQIEKHAKELFAQREWLRVTLGSIGDAVVATDTQGRIRFLNGVAQILTGWKEDEVVGQPIEKIFHIVHEETRQPAENPARQVLQTDTVVTLAHRTLLIAKNGQERPIDDSASPIRSDEGRTLGVVIVFRDVTERRRLETEVARRMQELAQTDRHKNEFLAMLAHELRNPLAPVRNALTLLHRVDPEDAKFEWAKEVIGRQVQQIAHLVDDLLDVSRISTGKIRLQKTWVELSEVVERAVEISRPLIAARRQELSESLPIEPIWLHADATRLAQVVSNLLNNAAKYTEQGGHIWLTVAREMESVILRVRDNGMGIAPDMLPRLFNLYTQEDRSLSRSQGGLGIGLTLVRRLVEMHGGSVHAQSAGPGKGSEFEVRLPIAATPPAASQMDDSGSSLQFCEPRRILVVDDSRDAAETLAFLLGTKGHSVHTAYDGPTALEAAQTFHPDVVLLDIGLPRMDGYEVARQLRRRAETENVLLVALTGYGHEQDRQRSAEAGLDCHLVKPVDPDELLELISRLSKHQPAKSPSAT